MVNMCLRSAVFLKSCKFAFQDIAGLNDLRHQDGVRMIDADGAHIILFPGWHFLYNLFLNVNSGYGFFSFVFKARWHYFFSASQYCKVNKYSFKNPLCR